jgi:hypothetical protein
MRNDLKQIFIKVIPNHANMDGCTFIIYKKTWFPFISYELGRLESIEKLRLFTSKYYNYNSKTLEHTL